MITTNEARYRIGEPVTVTVKNLGDETLTFPNSSGLKDSEYDHWPDIQCCSAQVMTELGPGASRMITWNQEDDNGNSVPTGDYTATVQATLSSSSSQSTSSQVSFEITE